MLELWVMACFWLDLEAFLVTTVTERYAYNLESDSIILYQH